MPLKINVNNKKKIEEAIAHAEDGVHARTFNSDVDVMVQRGEFQLRTLGIPKKYWLGCDIEYCPPMVANKYKWTAEGTRVVLRRYPSGWFLTWVYRKPVGSCSFGSNSSIRLLLSLEAHRARPRTYEI